MRHKGVAHESNDQLGQRTSLPTSLVCRLLSGRYVNFITPRKPKGWDSNKAALSHSFHVLLRGPHRSLVARTNLCRPPETTTK